VPANICRLWRHSRRLGHRAGRRHPAGDRIVVLNSSAGEAAVVQ